MTTEKDGCEVKSETHMSLELLSFGDFGEPGARVKDPLREDGLFGGGHFAGLVRPCSTVSAGAPAKKCLVPYCFCMSRNMRHWKTSISVVLIGLQPHPRVHRKEV
jgi:hypothetical protein